jgi:hypothetical protein
MEAHTAFALWRWQPEEAQAQRVSKRSTNRKETFILSWTSQRRREKLTNTQRSTNIWVNAYSLMILRIFLLLFIFVWNKSAASDGVTIVSSNFKTSYT